MWLCGTIWLSLTGEISEISLMRFNHTGEIYVVMWDHMAKPHRRNIGNFSDQTSSKGCPQERDASGIEKTYYFSKNTTKIPADTPNFSLSDKKLTETIMKID